METLAYILNKYSLEPWRKMPIEIPDTGRVSLAVLFVELGYKVGAEIGTEAGQYAEILCKANAGLHLTCVDPYADYDGYRDYKEREEYLASTYEMAKDRLKAYNVRFLKTFSMDALYDFPDASLDFVYIDANHEWPYITQDIYYWHRKVRPGGIIAGHDYYMSGNKDSRCHVKHAVIGYCNAMKINPWFVLGRNERIPGEIRDTSRSWFWVVE